MNNLLWLIPQLQKYKFKALFDEHFKAAESGM